MSIFMRLLKRCTSLLFVFVIVYFVSFTVANPSSVEAQDGTVTVEVPTTMSPTASDMCNSGWYTYSNNRGYPAYLTLNRFVSDPPFPITNSAQWQPSIPQAGRYRVEVLIPTHSGIDWECPYTRISWDTSSAPYTIHSAEGITTVVLDQSPHFDAWVPLGEFVFSAGSTGYVEIGDGTNEPSLSRTISVSAMRFVPVDAPPNPSANSISGRIRDVNNNGISGATVRLNTGQTVITDSNGNYNFTNLPQGNYTITPSKSGFTFGPPTLDAAVPPSASDKNFRGYDEYPVVFVHGWSGTNTECIPIDADQYFGNVDEKVQEIGHFVHYAQLETSMCSTPPIEQNVQNLRLAINYAKAYTGQPKVILIAHSMGGLVSRAYVENPNIYAHDVETLFTFGTPHQGIPIEPIEAWSKLSIATLCINQPAVCQFTSNGIRDFNRNYSARNPEVTYYTITGDTPWYERNALGLILDVLIDGPDDGIIPTESGIGLNNVSTRWVNDENHNVFGPNQYFSNGSSSYTFCILQILSDIGTGECGKPNYGDDNYISEADIELSEKSPSKRGVLPPNQVITYTLYIETGSAMFAVVHDIGSMEMSLQTPDGILIDQNYASQHPTTVNFQSDAEGTSYYFTDTVGGPWNLILRNNEPDNSNGLSYSAFAAFDSDISLSAKSNSSWYVPGSVATLSATLSGIDLSVDMQATVDYADGTTTTVSLAPQGDGTYKGSYIVPSSVGYSGVRVMASGVNARGVGFEREAVSLYQISPASAVLVGPYFDEPIPSPEDSTRYESLQIEIGVNAFAAGMFGLTGDLVDSQGNYVSHAFTTKDTSIGGTIFTLLFDGKEIYDSGRNGPYTLTNVVLTDLRDMPLIVGEAINVHTTDFYSYRDFGPAVTLNQTLYLPLTTRR